MDQMKFLSQIVKSGKMKDSVAIVILISISTIQRHGENFSISPLERVTEWLFFLFSLTFKDQVKVNSLLITLFNSIHTKFI